MASTMNRSILALGLIVSASAAQAQQATPHVLPPNEQCTLGAGIAWRARTAHDQGVSEDDFMKGVADVQGPEGSPTPHDIANVKKIADYAYGLPFQGDANAFRDSYKEKCLAAMSAAGQKRP